MKKKDIKEFIERNKSYIGFGNYDVSIKYERKIDQESYAIVDYDENEQSLELTINKNFFDFDNEHQERTLLHELIHARMGVFYDRIRVLYEEEEEKTVNDISVLCQKYN